MTKTIRINGKNMSIADFHESKGLHVGGYLDLRGTDITSLPEGLHVGGSLDLEPYEVSITEDGELKICRQIHPVEDWETFTDNQIAAMDGKATLKFWRTWKEPLCRWASVKRECDVKCCA